MKQSEFKMLRTYSGSLVRDTQLKRYVGLHSNSSSTTELKMREGMSALTQNASKILLRNGETESKIRKNML
jgi:hypothetical protein